MPPRSDVTRMSHEGIADAAAVLARAFQDDPLQAYTFPDEEERRRLSPAHFRATLDYGLQFGIVNAVSGGGVIVALPPGQTDVTPERAEQGGLAKLPELIGSEPAGRFLGVLGTAGPMHRRHAPGPHWYVMALGVSPEARDTGLGRALLESVFVEADPSRLPVYLETTQAANIAFYGHMGFAVVDQFREPTSGLDVWGFLRPPREVAAAPEPTRRPARPRRRYQGKR
jgi:ribosomal protein S18 acetylase RimI-like enzyme